MDELDPTVMLAVLLEMMGAWFWILGLLAVIGIAGFVYVLAVERTLSSRRLVRAELIGVLGGIGALVLMAYVTLSGFTDAGGPIDWLVIGLIFGGGLVGTTILAYAIGGLVSIFSGRKDRLKHRT